LSSSAAREKLRLPVFGGEAILVQGEAISQTTSGNFGYSTGKSLVLGYLPVEIPGESDFEIEAFGRRSRATIVKGVAYDPKKTKMLC
jgi:sarcosine dehydrogenase